MGNNPIYFAPDDLVGSTEQSEQKQTRDEAPPTDSTALLDNMPDDGPPTNFTGSYNNTADVSGRYNRLEPMCEVNDMAKPGEEDHSVMVKKRFAGAFSKRRVDREMESSALLSTTSAGNQYTES